MLEPPIIPLGRQPKMEKVYEDEYVVSYANDLEVRCEYKSGGTVTTLKHDPSWHDTAPLWAPAKPCLWCRKKG